MNRVLNTPQPEIFVVEKTDENRKAQQTANGQKELPGQTTNEWEGLPPTIAEQSTLT